MITVRSSGTNGDEADRISLFLPPPTYDEVITTNLYPPTPQIFHRRVCSQCSSCFLTLSDYKMSIECFLKISKLPTMYQQHLRKPRVFGPLCSFMGSKVDRKHLASEDARPVKGMASQLKMRNFLKSICTGTDLHPVSTILGLHIRCGLGLNRFYKKLS